MADLFVRSGNAWVEPTEVKVRNGVLWQDVNAVYLREGGTWVEKWPLTTLLLPDYVIVNIRTTGNANDVIFQCHSRQPDIMSFPYIKGGGYYWDPTILYSTGGEVRDPRTGTWTETIADDPNTPGWLSIGWVNPREQWYPEPTQDIYGKGGYPDPDNVHWPFNSFNYSLASLNENFRIGNYNGGYGSYHWNTSIGNWTINSTLINTLVPTVSYTGDIKRQFFINFKLWQEAFPPAHPAFTNPMTLGDILRFSFFAGWKTGSAPPDPSTVPLEFEIVYYKDGTVSRNTTTNIVSVSGASSTQTRNISYIAPTGAGTGLAPSTYSNLPWDFCAFEINGDFSTGTVNEITSFTNPFPNYASIPSGIFVNIPSPGVSAPRTQFFISDPLIDTSIYDFREFSSPSVTQALTYKYILNVSGGLAENVSNEADGNPGQTTPDEYLQEQSNFNQEGNDPWAAYPTKGTDQVSQGKWWMHAQNEYFAVSGLGRTGASSFMFFDIRQFKYDNPTANTVTLRVAAAGKIGNPSYSLTAQVSTLQFLSTKQINVNLQSGSGQTYVANVTKAITNTVPSTTSNLDAWPLGIGICDITFNYTTGVTTVTPL